MRTNNCYDEGSMRGRFVDIPGMHSGKRLAPISIVESALYSHRPDEPIACAGGGAGICPADAGSEDDAVLTGHYLS